MREKRIITFVIISIAMLMPFIATAANTKCVYEKPHAVKKRHHASCKTSRDYVNFDYAPTSIACSPNVYTSEDFYNPDMSTADDDVSAYPDMNIDR